jgi:hypothetical protein
VGESMSADEEFADGCKGYLTANFGDSVRRKE